MSGPRFLAIDAKRLVQRSAQELRHDVGVEAVEVVPRNRAGNLEPHLLVQVDGWIVVGSDLQVAFIRMVALKGG